VIQLLLYEFDGYVLRPNDISLGEAEQKEFLQADGTKFRRLRTFRRELVLKIVGITETDAQPYIAAASNPLQPSRTINIGGQIVSNAILVNATITAPVIIQATDLSFNVSLVDLTLTYESQDWFQDYNYLLFDGYPVDPEDVQFSTESRTVIVNDGGNAIEVQQQKFSITIILRGTPPHVAHDYLSVLRLSANTLNPPLRTIDVGGIVIEDALLIAVEPSSLIEIGGTHIRPALQLTYRSKRWTNDRDVVFKGFAVEEVQLGEAQSINVEYNHNGVLSSVPVIRRQITFVILGMPIDSFRNFENIARANRLNLINGNIDTEDITVYGITFLNCFLLAVQPSGKITFMDDERIQAVIESVTLIYESREWV